MIDSLAPLYYNDEWEIFLNDGGKEIIENAIARASARLDRQLVMDVCSGVFHDK